MYTLHPDKLVSVSRIVNRGRSTTPSQGGSNLVERLAAKLHAQRIASANPVNQLGQALREVPGGFPEPHIRQYPPVVIPGGPRAPRRPAAPRPSVHPIGTRTY